MPSYMTIFVIALAASNVSAALPVSMPVHSSREVREQSLSRRDPPDPPPSTPPPGYPPPGYRPPGVPPYEESETKPMLPQNYVPSDREQVGTPQKDVPPPNARPLHINLLVNTAATPPKKVMPPKGSNPRQYLMNFVVGTVATMVGATLLKAITGTGFPSSAPAASPTASTSSPSSSANPNSQSNPYLSGYTSSSTPGGQYGPGPGQYQNQQRDVDHGERADSFKPKDISNFDNNRRATSHLELLTRADLKEALNLLTRVSDELD